MIFHKYHTCLLRITQYFKENVFVIQKVFLHNIILILNLRAGFELWIELKKTNLVRNKILQN